MDRRQNGGGGPTSVSNAASELLPQKLKGSVALAPQRNYCYCQAPKMQKATDGGPPSSDLPDKPSQTEKEKKGFGHHVFVHKKLLNA